MTVMSAGRERGFQPAGAMSAKSQSGDAAVALAYATLSRGARFLGAGLVISPVAYRAYPMAYGAKVLGNGLRELDRFLNILIGEVARACGAPVSPNERNTANKLRRLRHALAVSDSDHARLVAMGRSRDCLFHCSGRVHRGDRPGDSRITAGWPEAVPHRVAVGGELTMTASELAEICDFYVAIADGLMPLASVPHRSARTSLNPPA
ncbi:hypothetical protein [Sphingomonas colocasiae]|uniref:Uncharacterized protein n=1 Tax=Sphingomonas colocasiae TaxID=1848973 RepID=A0ABS7PMG3_9SPHN|nr:hypothetical protein [Sphingomonas colocasiae]MBY8822505.1 hypothetical protein [Sphingomonas colocasiae]